MNPGNNIDSNASGEPCRERWLIVALALGAVLWFAWPLLNPGFLGWDGDRLCLFLPAMRFAREELFAGRIPLWNPHKFLGVPMLANQMVPFFYPPQTLALLPPQPWGLDAMLVGHYALAAVGAYLLARRGMGCRPGGAILAGITFGFSAPLTAAIAHPNQLCATAWMPLVWLATLGIGGPARPVRQILLFSLALAMQMLAGQPQMVVYGAILVGWTLIFRLIEMRGPLAGRWTVVGVAAAGSLLAAGLAAVQWLPAMELERLSGRRLLNQDFSSSFSLPWRNLLTLLLPDALGSPGSGGYHGPENTNFTESTIFIGQTSLALAVLGFIARRRDWRTWIAAAAAVSALLLALGNATPVLKWLTIIVPTIGHFRAPARAWTVAALALAVAAGWGLDAIGDWAARRGGAGARRNAIGLMIALELAGLGWFRFYLMAPEASTIDVLGTPTIESTLRQASPRPGRIFNLNYVDYNDGSRTAAEAKVSLLQPDLNSMAHLREFSGYGEGLLPTSPYLDLRLHFWRNLYTPTPDSRLLGLMGVEFFITDKDKRIGGNRWEPLGNWKGADIYRNRDYRGEVFTREDWPDVDFSSVQGFFQRSPPATQPVPIVQFPAPGAPAPPKIESERIAPSQVRVRVPQGWSGVLILSEGWAPGWRAVGRAGSVNGRPINAALMAFELPAGDGEWTLRYDPVSFLYGKMIGAAALAAILALALFSRRKIRPALGDAAVKDSAR